MVNGQKQSGGVDIIYKGRYEYGENPFNHKLIDPRVK